MNIAEQIWDECDKIGLLVDKHHMPIKVSSDCYMFYATKLSDSCKRQGICKEERYYAYTGGCSLKITQ